MEATQTTAVVGAVQLPKIAASAIDCFCRTSEKTFAVQNPVDGEILARVPEHSSLFVNDAIDRGQSRTLSPLDWPERVELLASIADLLITHKEDLARVITLEQGKPIRESRTEIDYAAGFFRYYAGLADPDIVEEGRRSDGRFATVFHRPAGVAALIVPWNFPLGMLAKKMAAALAAGCPVIVKPAEDTPISAITLWSLYSRSGHPDHLFQLVTGSPRPIGEIFAAHPDVRVISITGSTQTGRWFYERGHRHLKRLSLELGGNAPFIVFEDADVDLAVEEFVANKFRCAGQTCVCANRLFLHSAVEESFLIRLKERMERLRVGNGLEESTDIGPLINRRAFEKACSHREDALSKGAEVVLEGDIAHSEKEWGFFFPPTLLTRGTRDMLVSHEETFSPLVVATSFSSEEEVLKSASDTPYGLASYIFTTAKERAERLVGQLRFGHIGVNSGAGPSPEFPFGGMKESGFGREGGRAGLAEYCELQTVIGSR